MQPEHTQFDEDYYRNNGQLGDRPALGYYTRLVKRYIGGTPIIDFGCGTGHLVRHLTSLGQADGFEVSEYSAATARATAPGARVYGRLEDIPDSTYEALTAIHVVEHLTDDELGASFEVWRRVLRRDARILVVTPDLAGFGRALGQDSWNGFSDPTHINLKAHAEWKRHLEDGGFIVEHEGSDGLWDAPYSRLPRFADAAIHSVPSLAQFLSGRVILRPGTGESSIFVASRRD